MAQTDKLTNLLDTVINDGKSLVANCQKDKWGGEITDTQSLMLYANKLILFKAVAGKLIEDWSVNLQHDGYYNGASRIQMNLSALSTIREAISAGLLAKYEDLINADTFADLSEQASHLLSNNYFLAAGVIYRAVLEERLRGLCKRHNCLPSKPKPTINDFNQSLYAATPPVYDKTMMLNITSLASIGNDAAHNLPSLKKEDVERLKRGIEEFLARFSV